MQRSTHGRRPAWPALPPHGSTPSPRVSTPTAPAGFSHHPPLTLQVVQQDLVDLRLAQVALVKQAVQLVLAGGGRAGGGRPVQRLRRQWQARAGLTWHVRTRVRSRTSARLARMAAASECVMSPRTQVSKAGSPASCRRPGRGSGSGSAGATGSCCVSRGGGSGCRGRGSLRVQGGEEAAATGGLSTRQDA